MINIIDTTNEMFMKSICSALRGYGIDSSVQNIGVNPEQKTIYAVVIALASDATRARGLLYRDARFINDLNPELANFVQGVRNENLLNLGEVLQSKLMVKLSVIAFIALIIGCLLGY